MLIDPATGRVLLMSDAPIAGHMPVLLSFQQAWILSLLIEKIAKKYYGKFE